MSFQNHKNSKAYELVKPFFYTLFFCFNPKETNAVCPKFTQMRRSRNRLKGLTVYTVQRAIAL